MHHPHWTTSFLLPTLFASLAMFMGTGPALAQGLMPLSTDPGFSVTIDFDTDAYSNPLEDGEDVLDQYEALGVRFRDELSQFEVASGRASGRTEDDERVVLSVPNAFEANDEERVFILFAEPVREFGAYLLGQDDNEIVAITAFDTNLQPIGIITPVVNDEVFQFVGFSSVTPIAAVHFFNLTWDDFYIDELGITYGSTEEEESEEEVSEGGEEEDGGTGGGTGGDIGE